MASAPKTGEFNMLYTEPTNLYSELLKVKTKESKQNSFLSCPAVKDRFKRTYVFRNSLTSKFTYDFSNIEEGKIVALDESYVTFAPERVATLTLGPTIVYNMRWIMFAEEPLTTSFGPPLFHEPKYTKYGTVIPGAFDIGQWFRPFNSEMQMWSNIGEFVIEEDEPIFYAEFFTNKNIIFKRFVMTDRLLDYSDAVVATPKVYGKRLPLVDRYKRFNATRMKDVIMKEIKDNLI